MTSPEDGHLFSILIRKLSINDLLVNSPVLSVLGSLSHALLS